MHRCTYCGDYGRPVVSAGDLFQDPFPPSWIPKFMDAQVLYIKWHVCVCVCVVYVFYKIY